MDEQGNWLTTAAKEYPSKMCEMIARAFMRQMDARFPHLAASSEDWLLEDEVRQFYQPDDQYIVRDIGMDFFDAARRRGGTQSQLEEAREWASADRYVPPPTTP